MTTGRMEIAEGVRFGGLACEIGKDEPSRSPGAGMRLPSRRRAGWPAMIDRALVLNPELAGSLVRWVAFSERCAVTPTLPSEFSTRRHAASSPLDRRRSACTAVWRCPHLFAGRLYGLLLAEQSFREAPNLFLAVVAIIASSHALAGPTGASAHCRRTSAEA